MNLFDHLVGGREQRRRHSEAEHPGGLGVDDQFELRRLHHRQVRGLRALEDAAGINAEFRPSTICGLTPPFHPQPPAPAGAHDDIGGFLFPAQETKCFACCDLRSLPTAALLRK